MVIVCFSSRSAQSVAMNGVMNYDKVLVIAVKTRRFFRHLPRLPVPFPALLRRFADVLADG
jgi:hypothetical protein